MRKRIPVTLGIVLGLAYGLYLIIFVPSEQMPGFIAVCVGGLGDLLSKGASEAFAFVFVMCGVPLFCAALGGALGLAVGLLLKRAKSI